MASQAKQRPKFAAHKGRRTSAEAADGAPIWRPVPAVRASWGQGAMGWDAVRGRRRGADDEVRLL